VSEQVKTWQTSLVDDFTIQASCQAVAITTMV
jgi:hypothetical protein